MKFDFTKNTIYIESNGTKKDDQKVVMFHRLMTEHGFLDSSMLEESESGGIALSILECSTISELKQDVRYMKEWIKKEKIKPSFLDEKNAEGFRNQLNL